jgi:hypothetical protein
MTQKKLFRKDYIFQKIFINSRNCFWIFFFHNKLLLKNYSIPYKCFGNPLINEWIYIQFINGFPKLFYVLEIDFQNRNFPKNIIFRKSFFFKPREESFLWYNCWGLWKILKPEVVHTQSRLFSIYKKTELNSRWTVSLMRSLFEYLLARAPVFDSIMCMTDE